MEKKAKEKEEGNKERERGCQFLILCKDEVKARV